ncbi:MAG: TRAM domain-containing protein [Candidatus Micrarchaeia archaeon]
MKDYEEGEGENEESSEGEGRGEGRGGRRGMHMKPSYFMPKPVKVGDEIEVNIVATGAKGDGIAKKDGFVIFVPNAKEGEQIKVRITEVKARSASAERVQ